ncbi:MAG: helix-turn-helix transcriptional regulator [Elusimicrobiaceae bacterium]|nr:helix-turn-helix transcriptional regulator [Elusimicrobiaceae bacterium]
MMPLIDELEKFRLERRISQAKLAEMLGVSFVTVNRWFNDKTVPNKMQQYHIEKLLNAKES